MAAGYVPAIRQVEGDIQAIQAKLGIDQQRLGEQLSAKLQVRKAPSWPSGWANFSPL